jgi:hypothetical protein
MFATYGNFVDIEAAATGFELSFDNTHYIPMREGRLIQTDATFAAFYLRAPAGGAQVDGIAITGTGSITHFATYGGGGDINPAAPRRSCPTTRPPRSATPAPPTTKPASTPS